MLSTAQHSTAQHSTAQHSTAQHSTAQHSTAAMLLMCNECKALEQNFCKGQHIYGGLSSG